MNTRTFWGGISILLVAGVLSACSSDYVARELLLPECEGQDGKATTRAATCLVAAALETEHQNSVADEEPRKTPEKEAKKKDPRIEEWVP